MTTKHIASGIHVTGMLGDEFILCKNAFGLWDILHKNKKRNTSGYHKQNSGKGFHTVAQAKEYIRKHDHYTTGRKYAYIDRMAALFRRIE